MDLDKARAFVRDNHRAVLATTRSDGRPQLSPVTVGVDADGHVVISTRETAVKTRNVRRDPRVSICVMNDAFYGGWVQIEGTAEVVSLPDAMEHLVTYYRDISGEHPDWNEYRAAMIRDKRVIVRVTLTKAGPDVHG